MPRLDVSVELAGSHAAFVPDTGRGLSFITLLAGPRLYQPISRRFQVTEHFFAGAVRGFDAKFGSTDTATAFGFSAGAGVEYRWTQSISVRPEADFLRLSLPNGADNRQGEMRLGAAIVFRVPAQSIKR